MKIRDIELQQQKRFEKMQKSRWNRWYKEPTRRGQLGEVPRCLRKKGKERQIIRVARFRLGSEMRERRYWEEKKKRKYRICG